MNRIFLISKQGSAHKTFYVASIVILLAVLSTMRAHAAELDEIVVTAQKREQNIQDVGISISAMSGDQLQQRGIDNIDGIAEAIPNVQLFNLSGGGVPVVIIRGVGLQNFRINDSPTTGVYVDDVYQASIAQLEGTLFDLDRVELLKGPQGGLYGRNAVGGAVQYLSKMPNFEESEGYARIGYGEYSTVEAEGGFGGPISDTVAARVSGKFVNSSETYFRSTAGNFDHGEKDRWSARTILSFRPDGLFSADLKLHGGADNSDLPLYHTIGAYEPSGSNIIPGIADSRLLGNYCTSVFLGGREPTRCIVTGGETPASLGIGGRYDGATLERPRMDSQWWGVSLRGAWNFDNLTLTSISAFDQYDYVRITDQDTVPQAQQTITYRSDIDAWSQEVRLGYDNGGSVSGLAGLSYSEDTLEENTFLNAADGLFAVLFGSTTFEQPYEQESQTFAAFGRVDWGISDNLNLSVEARYTTEDKEFVGGVFFVDRNSFINQRNGDLIFIDSKETFDAVTGKVVLEWGISSDVLLYSSIARGFKTGGFFGGFALSAPELEPYQNEYILAYEVGVKSDWLEGRARVNGSLFYYDRTDVQANGSESAGGVVIDRLTNIGDVETFGAEVEATVIPMDSLTLNMSLGYVDTEIVKSSVLTEDIFTGEFLSPNGARLPQQPEFNFSVYGRYEFPVAETLEGGVQLEYSYRSEMDMELVKSPEEESFLREDGYGLLNFALSIGSRDDNWQLSGRLENAFDKEYRAVSRGITHGGLYEIWGAPRTWQLVFSRQW